LLTKSSELTGVRIVVDAGHGGHDQGATGLAGTLEKSINLAIAKQLALHLASQGAQILMTRSDDYYITLAGRCQLANQSGAHLFISVHVNAWPKPNGRAGTQVFYTHAHSYPLAKAVHDRMIALLGRRDGGLRARQLYVTNHTLMPSTLTETAYLNHAEEEKLLNDPVFRDRAAQAIALGVMDYAREHLLKRKVGAASSTTATGRVAVPEQR
jgi:N-acetylmuramoyl-L-alanine amidase